MVLSRSRRLTVGAVAVLPLVAACGDDDTATDDGAITVVATTGIWADITSMVACVDGMEVASLIPAGGDAHSYEPSLRDRQTLDDADLVVANGLGLEELLDDTIDDVEADGVTVLRAGELVSDPLEGGEHHDDDDDDGYDDEAHAADEARDPHVWFDPTRVSAALPALADALVDAGADRAAVDTCVADAQASLQQLDDDVTAALGAIPAGQRLLVTNHDALGYFADRYDFEILGTVLPSTSTLSEASPSELQALGDDIQQSGVPAIFTESLASADDAERLADRLGVEVVELYTDTLGPAGSGAATYEELMRFDAAAVAGALT